MELSRRHLVFTGVLALFLVVFLELGMVLLAAILPSVDRLLAVPGSSSEISPTVPDEQLVYRPNPAFPGHDRKGFRNPEVPEKAEVIALGTLNVWHRGSAG